MTRYEVTVERTELITFELDAESPEDAEEHYLFSGEEISSRTIRLVVHTIKEATS